MEGEQSTNHGLHIAETGVHEGLKPKVGHYGLNPTHSGTKCLCNEGPPRSMTHQTSLDLMSDVSTTSRHRDV
ncbi:hypothetical protein M404DRAFT_1002732 [Pisolithus tinctorius Marx 270]|uniref:Uncharacterized protein n=1 Tax=Pisolithus tinctorius Marx 270 TaxID=870435 RepID=A0A0C3IYU8_PISTI|nr:hypothetical protein M404DRAFT_1002732 [Pisolithus tinctorius Marx 270]